MLLALAWPVLTLVVMLKAKSSRKLTLATTTIKQLSTIELAQAAGGSPTTSNGGECGGKTVSRGISCSCAPGCV